MVRKVIDFAQSGVGRAVIFFAVFFSLAGLVYIYRGDLLTPRDPIPSNVDGNSVYSSRRDEQTTVMQTRPLKPVKAMPKKKPSPPQRGEQAPVFNSKPQAKAVNKKRSLSTVHAYPVHLSVGLSTSKEDEIFISQEYAPYGSILSCQLVFTIDSSNLEGPVLATVTRDLWHNGRLIIPAGTEVHGFASGGFMRDRIACQKKWVLVWKDATADNGKELTLSGIALDETRMDTESGVTWGITDGSAGLRGSVVENKDMKELIAIASVFLSGVANGYNETFDDEYYTSDGVIVSSSMARTDDDRWKSAISDGVRNAAEVYAKRMFNAISENGAFIRVPAGKTFYLYITQTIDLKDGKRAGTEFARLEEKAEEKSKAPVVTDHTKYKR